MANSTRRRRPISEISWVVPTAEEKAVRRHNGGFALLPFIVERAPSGPATDATWAWSLRRFARGAVWLLPGYAIVYGAVTLVGGGSAPYYTSGGALYLIGWVGAIWLGLLAVMALTSLLAAARCRRSATAGLLVGLAGIMLLLPFAGLPAGATVFGTQARTLALVASAVYSLGWLLTGWALLRSGVFSYADGVLLMVAAPLLGIGGMLVGPLQTLGAFFALAAGIGVAWRAGRLVPEVGRPTMLRTAGVVGASVAAVGRAVAVKPAAP